MRARPTYAIQRALEGTTIFSNNALAASRDKKRIPVELSNTWKHLLQLVLRNKSNIPVSSQKRAGVVPQHNPRPLHVLCLTLTYANTPKRPAQTPMTQLIKACHACSQELGRINANEIYETVAKETSLKLEEHAASTEALGRHGFSGKASNAYFKLVKAKIPTTASW